MSGHSKWAKIKHKKSAVDAKRGKIFTRLIKEITIAARDGGGNPDTNIRLRAIIQKAREANMPQDNVKNAIKKGTGELPGVIYETIIYEGYGPKGVAIIVEVITDNKNRASAEIRNIFAKRGGNMAGAGSVAWMFSKKGEILVDKNQISEDKLVELALEAGAEDVKTEDDIYEIVTQPNDLEKVKSFLTDHKIALSSAEVTMTPSTEVKLAGEDAKQVLDLVEALEDNEDVQNVYANFDIPEDILQGEG